MCSNPRCSFHCWKTFCCWKLVLTYLHLIKVIFIKRLQVLQNIIHRNFNVFERTFNTNYYNKLSEDVHKYIHIDIFIKTRQYRHITWEMSSSYFGTRYCPYEYIIKRIICRYLCKGKRAYQDSTSCWTCGGMLFHYRIHSKFPCFTMCRTYILILTKYVQKYFTFHWYWFHSLAHKPHKPHKHTQSAYVCAHRWCGEPWH